jgi:hypothetical protein
MSERPQRAPLGLPAVLDGKPHRVSMGLRPLDVTTWLDPDEHRDAELLDKARLLNERHDEVFAALPGSEAAGSEVLDLVLQRVRSADPPLIQTTDLAWHDLAIGLAIPRHGLHPLDAAARMVQEDLCVMERDAEGVWILTAASVCFPSRWLLADKIGQSLTAIHGPVPGYARIERATDVTFDRMSHERPVQRTNWTLIDDPALFQPRPEARGKAGGAVNGATDPVDVLSQVFLRVEEQTLRLLPATGGVLFTIRTRVDPLQALTATSGARLAATLATVDDETVAYRGWQHLLPRVIAALDENR